MLHKIFALNLYPFARRHERFYSKGGVLETYLKKVKNAELTEDDSQLKVAAILDTMREELKTYSPPKPGFFNRLLSSKRIEAPIGLYLHGSVGCGKTMLMDVFHERCTVDKRKRTHFHSFMLDVHSRIHEYKKVTLKQKTSRKMLDYDPIGPVAKSISSETWMLCLDEFQVTDIGDAMILKRLFTELFDNGTVLFATSNRPPDDLYRQGLQRSNFLPFISILKKFCLPIYLDSGVDYRMKFFSSQRRTFFVFSECDADRELDAAFKYLASRENEAIRPRTLNIKNRNVTFPITCGHVADCTFEQLCDRIHIPPGKLEVSVASNSWENPGIVSYFELPLGAVDYLVLSQVFHTILIRNIPQMSRKQKSQARRFITLIDTFYDNKVRILCSSDVPPKKLFSTATNPDLLDDENRSLMDDLNIGTGSENAGASIFSGEEEVFAFDRTVSRLTEMQTDEYWKQRINVN